MSGLRTQEHKDVVVQMCDCLTVVYLAHIEIRTTLSNYHVYYYYDLNP